MSIVLKSGSLNLLKTLGPVQACNGIALLLPYLYLTSFIEIINEWILATNLGRNKWDTLQRCQEVALPIQIVQTHGICAHAVHCQESSSLNRLLVQGKGIRWVCWWWAIRYYAEKCDHNLQHWHKTSWNTVLLGTTCSVQRLLQRFVVWDSFDNYIS
jgi:hypothetical protein